MSQAVQTFFTQMLFRWSSLSILDVIDLFLVVVTFYTLLYLVQRSQAAFLLRGLLVLILLLVVTTLIFPLPTFDYIIFGGIMAGLIALPITLQPELRGWLERLGRRTGLTQTTRQDMMERVMPRLLRTMENLSAHHVGALIVLEREESLEEVVRSGVSVNGLLTSELLQTIFHDKTPLHDGAVIVRGEMVVAAGCVLPLTQQDLTNTRRRYGTRHRAATGMSETRDALVLVVSEETGKMATAYKGKLEGVDSSALRQQLVNFYTEAVGGNEVKRSWMPAFSLRTIANQLLLGFTAILLSLAVWAVVLGQTNPTEIITLERLPLQVVGLPPNMAIVGDIPSTVNIEVMTTKEVRPTLNINDFVAELGLATWETENTSLSVGVTTNVAEVRVLSVMPAFIPLDLVPIITQTIPVQVQLTNQSGLSTAYEVAGQPTTRPSNAIIQGAAPLVALVATVEATLPINGVSASFRETRTLVAVDKNGNTIEGITIEPAEVEVQLWVVRRSDALDVGVRAMTTEAPPDGYWLSGLQVSPPSITLRGEPARLAEMGGFVDTLPIDLSLAFGTLTVQIPLDLPADIQAVDNAGNVITNVTVEAQVSARTGDILLTRPVEILTPDSEDVIIVPESVELLLSGPLPLLNEIEANPELLRVTLTTTGIRVGESEEREPQVIAPEGITVQLVQPTILVTKELN